MAYLVLVTWIVQGAAGSWLLINALRHRPARRSLIILGLHVGGAAGGLALWIAFLMSDRAYVAWVAFAVINVANVLGDVMLIARWKRQEGPQAHALGAYAGAFKGRYPASVTFHAFFGGVVYFLALATCIKESI